MKTETAGSRTHHWHVYWIGLCAAAIGGGWLAVSAPKGFAAFAQGGARAANSPWLIVEVLCASTLVIVGFVAMAGSSAFAPGSTVDFDRVPIVDEGRQVIDGENIEFADGMAPVASRWPSAPGDVDHMEFEDTESPLAFAEPEQHGPPKPFIMIRCRRCETLNSEHRSTCTACEHPI